MIKIKAPVAMIAAVKKVSPTDRIPAAALAESVFFTSLEKLRKFDDYPEATNIAMAGEAAAAEVAFRFA